MKLVCMFSGWFEIDTDDVLLIDPQEAETETKTATEWLALKGNIDGLMLDSFNDANSKSTDGCYEELDLSIEED